MPEQFLSQPYLSNASLPPILGFQNGGIEGGKADMLSKIESGEIDHLDFQAVVFKGGKNRNFYRFPDAEMSSFAATYEGRPFLRNHDEYDIDARDGTILRSFYLMGELCQDIRLTTRKGMISLLEGQIDRFSIGWFFDKVTCSVCTQDFRTCHHWPGREYTVSHDNVQTNVLCEVIFSGLSGKETSAVNVPAVEGTSILANLKANTVGAGSPSPTTSRRTSGKEKESMTAPILSTTPQDPPADNMPAQTTEGAKLLAQQCGFVLTAALNASNLPELTRARIKRQFDGQVFQLATLDAEIEAARTEVASLSAASLVQGPARISGMAASADQVSAAVDDLLGAPRSAGQENLKPARLSGIRELYLLTTGDYELHGGFYPERASLATTSDFSGLVKNALNKVVARQWEALGRAGYDWWQSIVKVEHFESLNDITGILTGTVGALSTVAEQGEYTELPIGDSPETASFTKYGNYIPLTLELIDRDETRKLKQYPIELANAGIRNISKLIAAVFTDNAAIGPTMADTGALFNTTAVTTLGGHKNLLTTALTAAEWDVVAAAMYNQPMLIKQAAGYYGTGSKMAVEPRFCLVPRALRKAAFDAFLNAWDVTDNKHSENLLKGNVVPLVVPEWTDATDWAAVADPAIVPGIVLGERFGIKPEIFIANRETAPAVFMNDEHRLKVRHFLAVLVQDFRPLHKSNV
ncbi:MAG: hypothetical protein A2X25_14435 [Chloroflexi bacterium GWB2_49_20]|nr:MAG: hypothetical protein A2X25_14435 [Chloroflexi bacterium GWB2_49_20]